MRQRRGNRAGVRRSGFGLMELLIAMVVAAVLLGLAIPSYHQYVIRAHRAEAVQILLGVVACQERLRAQRGYYDTSRCASGLDTGHYRFVMEPADETDVLEFRVVAVPRNPSATDGCGNLSLDQAGARAITGPGAWVDCWGGR